MRVKMTSYRWLDSLSPRDPILTAVEWWALLTIKQRLETTPEFIYVKNAFERLAGNRSEKKRAIVKHIIFVPSSAPPLL